ncbi:hypothetical protein predicted by Glimmer/Critica [Sorangium cellulosum So ce56]|uniref:Uncharacterized protein n=1 Tax=Sorangium cellulosum (strain So ce56) TaxID=448385 RepID=A9F990_SORC5|nr:hypothetical protein predicted by Glimmer/Critica [Sorangium cellulosum So ce56]
MKMARVPSPQERLMTTPESGFARRDTLGPETAVWSPYGSIAPLVIRMSVDIDNSQNSAGTGRITVREQSYRLTWRRCSR